MSLEKCRAVSRSTLIAVKLQKKIQLIGVEPSLAAKQAAIAAAAAVAAVVTSAAVAIALS